MDKISLGRWAFALGILIAILIGFVDFSYSTIILVVLGLIVGFLNVTDKETHNYLVAVIAMLVIGFSGMQVFAILNTGFYFWVEEVLTSFVTFVAASGIVVAVRAIFKMGEN